MTLKPVPDVDPLDATAVSVNGNTEINRFGRSDGFNHAHNKGVGLIAKI